MGSFVEDANIFVTGGAGSLGRALARKRKEEGWSGKFTVYSTDNHKHEYMRRMFPDVGFVQGDIRNPETLYNAMVGHDIVIHAAAVKVIPDSEYYSIDTYDVNVNGSLNVCIQALRAGINHVLGISTDKACHPANAYGATKMLMEKTFQEYARIGSETQFHLVRYGNVLESTGSVIEAWKTALRTGGKIRMTNPEMTRFWLSPKQAAVAAVESLKLPSGCIFVPRLPALPVGELARYTLENNQYEIERIPLRPGEKMHETLVTAEETVRAQSIDVIGFIVHPTTGNIPIKDGIAAISNGYSSDDAPWLTRKDLQALLND